MKKYPFWTVSIRSMFPDSLVNFNSTNPFTYSPLSFFASPSTTIFPSGANSLSSDLSSIVIVLEIVGGLIVLINTQDAFGVLPIWTILIYCCVYIFGIFGIYCGIKIIDFLFELDKNKADKVN